MFDDMLTRHEAAAEARLSVYTIDRWIKVGKLKSYRMGRRVLIRRDDLAAMITPAEDAA